MKKILFISIIISICLGGQSQIKFSNDPSYWPSELDHQIDSIYKLKEQNDFELRFEITPSPMTRPRETTVFIMDQNDQQWHARLFRYTDGAKGKYRETTTPHSDLSTLWDQLVEQNILTIPNSALLKDKNGNDPGSCVTDGTSYRFELITKEARRSYTYGSPEGCVVLYPYIQEFKAVAKIIDIISKYCSL